MRRGRRSCRRCEHSNGRLNRISRPIRFALVDREQQLFDAGVGAGVEHADQRAVGGVGVADDEHAGAVGVLLAGSAELRAEVLVAVDFFVVDVDDVVLVDRDDDERRVVEVVGRLRWWPTVLGRGLGRRAD